MSTFENRPTVLCPCEGGILDDEGRCSNCEADALVWGGCGRDAAELRGDAMNVMWLAVYVLVAFGAGWLACEIGRAM